MIRQASVSFHSLAIAPLIITSRSECRLNYRLVSKSALELSARREIAGWHGANDNALEFYASTH